MTALGPDNTTVSYGDVVLEIPADSVKFNLEVYTWPFCSEENSLSLGVDVKEGGVFSQYAVRSLFIYIARSTY